MKSFLGHPCPWCGKIFADGDDIVVCPECGTPHHRDCYKEHASCANEAQHSEDFEWKGAPSPAVTAKSEDVHSDETIRCSNCGTENSKESRYCSNCGAPFGNVRPRVFSPEEEFRREKERIVTESLNTELEGISAKEAAIHVRSNIGYFLPRFAAFSRGAKFDTNFSAFIFSYFYLFYRKMYGLGILTFIVTSVLSIPTLLLDLVTIQEQYVDMGLISQIIWEIPHQKELAVYSVIASVFIWIIRIALMMFFNRMYYSKVISDVKKAREVLADKTEKEILAYFHKKGGTSLVIPIILFCAVLAAGFILAGAVVTSEYFIIPELAKIL